MRIKNEKFKMEGCPTDPVWAGGFWVFWGSKKGGKPLCTGFYRFKPVCVEKILLCGDGQKATPKAKAIADAAAGSLSLGFLLEAAGGAGKLNFEVASLNC